MCFPRDLNATTACIRTCTADSTDYALQLLCSHRALTTPRRASGRVPVTEGLVVVLGHGFLQVLDRHLRPSSDPIHRIRGSVSQKPTLQGHVPTAVDVTRLRAILRKLHQKASKQRPNQR